MADFVCIRKCYHKGRIWNKGDAYVSVKDEKVPHHFAPKGSPIPEDPTPKLGTKVTGKSKPLPSVRAPGKKDFPEPKEA